jgi:hypothetical protein
VDADRDATLRDSDMALFGTAMGVADTPRRDDDDDTVVAFSGRGKR